MSLIIEAAQFAERAHKGQSRKWTNAPYITHPARVAARVTLDDIASEETIAAAWLHDVVEDTAVSLDQIRSYFGFSVARIVEELTNSRQFGADSRSQRKERDRQRLSRVSHRAKVIKLIDRIDNLGEIAKAPVDFRQLYLEESRLLFEVLRSSADSRIEFEFWNVTDIVEESLK